MYKSDYFKNVVMFEVYGETGLRELRFDHKFKNEDELRIGIAFLGLSVGPQSDIKIQFPNYMTKERYDRSIRDLAEQYSGSGNAYQ